MDSLGEQTGMPAFDLPVLCPLIFNQNLAMPPNGAPAPWTNPGAAALPAEPLILSRMPSLKAPIPVPYTFACVIMRDAGSTRSSLHPSPYRIADGLIFFASR